jgi:hypothetical protein
MKRRTLGAVARRRWPLGIGAVAALIVMALPGNALADTFDAAGAH